MSLARTEFMIEYLLSVNTNSETSNQLVKVKSNEQTRDKIDLRNTMSKLETKFQQRFDVFLTTEELTYDTILDKC